MHIQNERGKMMFRRIMVFTLMLGMATAGLCRADSWEANINAGTTSVLGGVHYKKDLQTGYMKAGVSGLYTDDDDLEYKWVQAKFAVGSDNIRPGLTLQVGVDGIFGDAEERGFSGDVGAIPLTGYICYTFPRRVIPLPLEVFGELSYAPEMLSFADTDDFLSYRVGAGVQVVPNASVRIEYQYYDVDMEAGPGPWNLDDGVIRASLVMRF
jgi:opacity protein-like surface antigen